MSTAQITAADQRIAQLHTVLDGVAADLHSSIISAAPVPDETELMAYASQLLAEVAAILTGSVVTA